MIVRTRAPRNANAGERATIHARHWALAAPYYCDTERIRLVIEAYATRHGRTWVVSS